MLLSGGPLGGQVVSDLTEFQLDGVTRNSVSLPCEDPRGRSAKYETRMDEETGIVFAVFVGYAAAAPAPAIRRSR
jgi:hypothetical protein